MFRSFLGPFAHAVALTAILGGSPAHAARPTLIGPPEHNPVSQQEVTAFYFGYHAMTQGYYNLNDGDVAACKPGKTWPVWRQSLIAAHNYYRRTIGLGKQFDVVDAAPAQLEYIQKAQTVQGSARTAAGLYVYGHGIANAATVPCLAQIPWKVSDITSEIVLGGNIPNTVADFIGDGGRGNEGVGHRTFLFDPNYKWVAWGGTTWESSVGGSDFQAAFSGGWEVNRLGGRVPLPQTYTAAWPPAGLFPWPLLPRQDYIDRNDVDEFGVPRNNKLAGVRFSYTIYPGTTDASPRRLDKVTTEVRVNGQLKVSRVDAQNFETVTIAVDDPYHAWRLPPVGQPDVIEVTLRGVYTTRLVGNQIVADPAPDIKWTSTAYNPFDDGGGAGDLTASRVVEYYLDELTNAKKEHFFYTMTDPALQGQAIIPNDETCRRLNGNPSGPECLIFLSSKTAYLEPAVRPKDETWVVDEGFVGPWQRTWRGFYAWKKAVAPADSVPVARFYCGPCNSHFYTASPAEREFLKSINPTNDSKLGWALETNEAFFIRLPQAGQCPANTLPVYRAYNQGDDASTSATQRGKGANHLLTVHAGDIRAAVANGWMDEGVVMCSPVQRPVQKIGDFKGNGTGWRLVVPPYGQGNEPEVWVRAN